MADFKPVSEYFKDNQFVQSELERVESQATVKIDYESRYNSFLPTGNKERDLVQL